MTAPPDELPGRTRPPLRRARLVLAVLTVLGVAVVVLPDLLGLDDRSPFVQIVSFRPALLAGLLVLAAAATGAAVVRRRGRSRTTPSRRPAPAPSPCSPSTPTRATGMSRPSPR